VSRRKSEIAFSAALALLAAYWVWEARNYTTNVRLVPWTIGFPVLALALLQLAAAIRASRAPDIDSATTSATASTGLDFSSADAVAATATAELAEVEPAVPPDVARARGLQMFYWILGFFFGIVLLGFRVGAPVTTFLFLRYASKETVRLSVMFAVGTYLFLLLAGQSHSVSLSSGMIAQTLGLESFDSYLVDPIIRVIRGQ
jgi:hypothetical protein